MGGVREWHGTWECVTTASALYEEPGHIRARVFVENMICVGTRAVIADRLGDFHQNRWNQHETNFSGVRGNERAQLKPGVGHYDNNAMNGMELTPSDWLALIKHVKQWTGNLGRAGKERKKQSKKALRAVLLAVRETEAYVTDLNEGHPQSRGREREISSLWSSLAFELEDLDLNKLAKVCRIKGKYWATRRQDGTSAFTEDFLKKAGTRLSDIESAANLALRQVNG